MQLLLEEAHLPLALVLGGVHREVDISHHLGDGAAAGIDDHADRRRDRQPAAGDHELGLQHVHQAFRDGERGTLVRDLAQQHSELVSPGT